MVKNDKEKVQEICGLCINIAKNLSIILQPILPKFSEELQKQLNLENLKWKDIGFDLKNHKIGKEKLLVRKIEVGETPNLCIKPAKKIEYEIDPGIRGLGINICLAQINGIKVKNKHEGLEKIKKQVAQKIKKLSQELYNNIGVDLQPSVAHLINLIKEKGRLPTINTAVDSYNVVSADKFLTAGCHDIDKIKGEVRFKITAGNEKFVPLNGKNLEKVNKGEFAFVDEEEILCRLDAKQSQKSKVDEKTQNVLLYFQGNRNVKHEYLRTALEEACKNIVTFCGGSYEILKEKAKGGLFPLNLKVAEIVDVKDHPDAHKLYVLQINLGKEKRQLVAGLKEHYSKDELKNKKIIVVMNLKYAKLRGVESQGMLLAAEDKNGTIGILTVKDAEPGDTVKCGNLENSNEQITFKDFQKLEITAKSGKVICNNAELKTGNESVYSKKVKEGKVR